MIEVYFDENSELAELEAIHKGYRVGVYVKVEEEFYQLSVYTITRLNQDFEEEVNAYGIYDPEVNLVLVDEANTESIIKIAQRCFDIGYFNDIKAISIDDETLVKVG